MKETNDIESYRQIVKSTSITGGSSIITTLLRIVRTKVLALILGPSGIGLIGIFDSITSLVSTIAGMGIATSGVRQIAEAYSTGDHAKISRTITSLRRMALITGVAGLFALILLSGPISRLTFGNSDHVRDIALLSGTVLFGAVSGGQTALIQGMRRIRDLAILSILGALLGTLLSIPIVYIFGERGIVLFLLIVSAMSILTSWLYSRQIKVGHVELRWEEIISEAKPLLKLGLVFMSTTLMALGTLYLVRVFIVRHLGLGAAGIYQAAVALSSVYIGFILSAMGKDFYPRLTALAQNNNECKSLVNKQIEIGLLLASPGILAIITLAPFVITILYSSKFMLAVDILRWQILGALLSVATWPMGFLLQAKGNGKLYFFTEIFNTITHLSLAWFGIKYFNLSGTGMAYFGMNLFYCILIFWVGKTHYEFIISTNNIRLGATIITATGAVVLMPYILNEKISLLINVGITIAIGLYSTKTIVKLTGAETIQNYLLKIKTRFSI